MLNRQQRVFEAARALVEDEGLRIKAGIERYRAGDIEHDAIAFEGSIASIREGLKNLDLPSLVMAGVEHRMEDPFLDADRADEVMELLFKLGCDFIEMRDWTPG